MVLTSHWSVRDLDAEIPLLLCKRALTAIEPEVLAQFRLDQKHVDAIAGSVPGGIGNVQDIYPLSPPAGGYAFPSSPQ